MNILKIAFIKQEVYQDLYVCPHTEKESTEILFSSIMRVGPFALISELNADFYIIKEELEQETQIYRKIIPNVTPYLHMLKTETADKMPHHEFIKPGSPYPNGKFAVSCDEVNWGDYDIVISVNVCLPTRVVMKYPQTLFAYMIGEANMAMKKARFGYDITLNQMARGIVAKHLGGEVDFPYTFLNSTTLADVMKDALGRESKKQGIFMEINSTTERPVTKVPQHFKPLVDNGYDIILHRQNIKENLTAIYDSKYFLKMGGRTIRGNSVAEAISLGSLAIMNREQVIHKELIIDECNVKTMDEALKLINKLEKENSLYNALLEKQRKVLASLFFEIPLQSLENCLIEKRKSHPRYSWIDRNSDILYLGFCECKNKFKMIKELFKGK